MTHRSYLPASKYGTDPQPPSSQAQIEFIPGSKFTSPGLTTRLGNFIQHIKSHKNYTEAIGRDLRIYSSEDVMTQRVRKLGLFIERNEGCERVKILFTKNAHDGISLESRRNNGEWESLCIAITRPCYDERPLLDAATAEVREYRANWWDNDCVNGEFSPTQRITVAP